MSVQGFVRRLSSRRFFVAALASAVAVASIPFTAPVAHAAAPARPVITDVTIETLSFVVTYKPGINSGASLDVEYSTDAGATWYAYDTPCTSATCTVRVTQESGTGNAIGYGQAYDVVIKVTNADGSAESASYPVYFITSPAAPIIRSAVATSLGINLEFTLGADGGAAISAIDYSTNNGTSWRPLNCSPCASASSALLTTTSSGSTFTAGSTYVLSLRAKNRAGTSAASAAFTVTSARPPAAPVLTSLTAATDSIVVAGTLGSSNGAAISDVEYSTDNGSTWRSSGQATASFTITLKSSADQVLESGVVYQVRIRAVNAAGTSPASAAKNVSPIDSPMPPVLDNVTAGTASMAVKGTLGLLMGGAVQRVEYSTDGGASWLSSGQLTGSFAITAPSTNRTSTLTPGVRYQVAIRVVTQAGISGASNVIEAMVGRVPGAPVVASAVPRAGAIFVSGTVGLTNGTPVIRLDYSTDNGATWWPANVVSGGASSTTPSPSTTVPATGSTTTTVPSTSTTTTTVPSASTPSLTQGSAFVVVIDTLSRDGATAVDTSVSYSVRIRAVSAVGAGSASTAIKSTTATAGDSSSDSATHRVTFTDPGTRILGSTPFAPTATSNLGATVTVTSSTPSVCTVSAGTVTLVAAGTCTLAASAPAFKGGAATSTVRSFKVTDKISSLDVSAAASVRDLAVSSGKTVPAGAKVSASTRTPKVCRVAGGIVTAAKKGSCRLTVTVKTAGKTRKFAVTVPVVAATSGGLSSRR